MKTSSWRTYTGPGRVGISLGTPRGAPAGYRLFKALAPTREMLALHDIEVYQPRYEALLAQLDPQATWDALHKLHGEGIEPVILCFEKPPLDRVNFCHRRMAADWFERHLGVVVPELGFEQGGLL